MSIITKERAMSITMKGRVMSITMKERAMSIIMMKNAMDIITVKKAMDIIMMKAAMNTITMREKSMGRTVPADVTTMPMGITMRMRSLPAGEWKRLRHIVRRILPVFWKNWKRKGSMDLSLGQREWSPVRTADGYTLIMCPGRAMCAGENRM